MPTLTTRPTTADIAREAGVSLATVDRVLNERPGASKKSIERVNKAVADLGYVRDVTAANLARQRRYRFAFVLPEDDGQFQVAMRDEVTRSGQLLTHDRLDVAVKTFASSDPHQLVEMLNTLTADTCDGVAIMAPETPLLRDAIRRLKAAGLAVVALVSDLPSTDRDYFIGVDNQAAGQTAGVLMGRFLGSTTGNILVIASSMLTRASSERRLGFDHVMQQQFAHLNVLPSIEFHEDAKTLERAVTHTFEHESPLGIYVVGSGNRALSDVLRAQGALTANADKSTIVSATKRPVIIGHELTTHNRQALEHSEIDAVINQNTGHIVRSALRVMRAFSDDTSFDLMQERIRIDIVLKENLESQIQKKT